MNPQTRKNPFLKYVMKNDKKEDIFHSSTYGISQSGEAMGVASSEAFSKRRSLDHNRQYVAGFKESQLVTGAPGQPRAKTYTPPARTMQGPTKSGFTPVSSRPAPLPPKNPGIHI